VLVLRCALEELCCYLGQKGFGIHLRSYDRFQSFHIHLHSLVELVNLLLHFCLYRLMTIVNLCLLYLHSLEGCFVQERVMSVHVLIVLEKNFFQIIDLFVDIV
jgi:VanZ family protein